MLGDPIVLKDAAAVDTTFNLVSTVTDPKTLMVTTRRSDAARTDPSQPRILQIQNSITGVGVNRVRRVTVKLLDTKLNTAGVPYTLTTEIKWVFPLNSLFGNADLDAAVCLAADLVLSTASLAVDSSKRTALQQGQA